MQQPSVSWKFSMSRRKLCVNKHSYRSSFHRLIEVIVEDHPSFAFQKLQHTGGFVVCLYQQRQGGWRRFQHHITTSVRFPSLWLDLDDPERCLNPMGWRSASHSHLHPDVDQWTSNAQSRGKLENHQIFWYFIRYSHAKTTLFFFGCITAQDPSAKLSPSSPMNFGFRKPFKNMSGFQQKSSKLKNVETLCLVKKTYFVLTLDWNHWKLQPRLPVLYLNLCQRHQLTLIQWRYHATLDATKWLQCCPKWKSFYNRHRPHMEFVVFVGFFHIPKTSKTDH